MDGLFCKTKSSREEMNVLEFLHFARVDFAENELRIKFIFSTKKITGSALSLCSAPFPRFLKVKTFPLSFQRMNSEFRVG